MGTGQGSWNLSKPACANSAWFLVIHFPFYCLPCWWFICWCSPSPILCKLCSTLILSNATTGRVQCLTLWLKEFKNMQGWAKVCAQRTRVNLKFQQLYIDLFFSLKETFLKKPTCKILIRGGNYILNKALSFTLCLCGCGTAWAMTCLHMWSSKEPHWLFFFRVTPYVAASLQFLVKGCEIDEQTWSKMSSLGVRPTTTCSQA